MPLPLPAKRAATYDDLRRVPEHLVAEIVDGELYTSPRPAARHARAVSRLGSELDGPFDRGRGGPGGWIILYEPELHLAGQVMVPDLAGWRRTRMAELPDVAAFELAPDWICEVLSPGNEAFDRSLKMPRYAEAGIPHAWLIDPGAQTVEVYEMASGGWHLVARHAGEAPIRARPFDAVEIQLASLWAR